MTTGSKCEQRYPRCFLGIGKLSMDWQEHKLGFDIILIHQSDAYIPVLEGA